MERCVQVPPYDDMVDFCAPSGHDALYRGEDCRLPPALSGIILMYITQENSELPIRICYADKVHPRIT